jgi:hypothetical protein
MLRLTHALWRRQSVEAGSEGKHLPEEIDQS